MEQLSALPWGSIGPTGLCAMFVVAILWGRLVPGSTVDRLITAKDDRIKELMAAVEASEERERILAKQNMELLETGRAAVQVLNALPPAAERTT